MVVFDTDILTLFFVGQERIVERHRAATEEVTISVVTRIEVLQGRFATLLKAADGAAMVRAQERLDQAERHLAAFRVLGFDEPSAREFDRLRADRRLRKVGRNDILIASITLAHRAMLVTRNVRHYRPISGLRVENWAD